MARLAERAEGATITGSEDVTGSSTTIVGFQMPASDLLVDAIADAIADVGDIYDNIDGGIDLELWVDGDGWP